MQTLRHALRALARTPVLTAVAVLSLALGMGANAALFSLVDQLLLRALPAADPGRLVNLGAPGPKPGGNDCNNAGPCDDVLSHPMFRDLARLGPARSGLAGLAAHRLFRVNLAAGGQTVDGDGMLVSGSYFPVLGLAPALGRLLGPADDDRAAGGPPAAVLSYAFWETRLGADPAAVGRTVVVNGQPLAVVGVAPRGFAGTTLGERPQVFVPLALRDRLTAGAPRYDDRRSYWLYAFGRLAPGVSADEAARRLNAAYRPIIAEVEAPLQTGMTPRAMAQFRAKRLTVAPGARGQSRVHADMRTPFLLLFATTGVVLLIACANVANLLLARGAARAGELAVRVALGASRRRLLTQLLAESGVLALAGGALGLVVARATLVGVDALLPADAAGVVRVALSPEVALFAAALALATGLVAGAFPALHSTRPGLVGRIRASAGQVAGGSRAAARFRAGLVGAQIALSMALLVSAALFIRSLRNVARADLGVAVERVVTFGVSPERNGYTAARSQALFARLERELAAAPGVSAVAASRVPLLASSNTWSNVSVEGFRRAPDGDADAAYNEVSPGYFRALGVPLRAGREFTDADRAGAPPVAVVNEAFARKFGLGRGAVGRRMARGEGGPLDVEIVGVVPDVKYSEVKDAVPPLFYTPARQDTAVGAMSFYVRTSLPEDRVLRALPAVVRRLDANLPVEKLRTMAEQVRDNTFLDRVLGTLAAAFAALATLLAAVGLYGVLAYAVAQRTRELGVRMALGAAAADVRALVFGQVGRLVAAGGLLGLAAGLGVGRAARSLLYGVGGDDPAAIAAAALVLAAVGLGAAYVPARRAARVDPTQALRYE